jgi:anti-sigma B factor antagonist
MPPAPKLLTHAVKDVTAATILDAHVRDLLQIQEIAAQLYDLVDNRNCRKLLLDFSKVQTLSSQALGALINLEKKLADIKGRLVLCGIRPEIGRLFELARLQKHFKIVPDDKAGLAAFGVAAGD